MTDTPSPEGSPRPPLSPGRATPPPPPPAYPPYAYAAPPKRGGMWSKLFGTVLVSVLLVSLVANVYLGLIVSSLTGGPSEQAYLPGESENRVVILPIEGTIDSEMAEFVRESLQVLRNDPPAALVLRIVSGGGGVTASDQILHHLNQFKDDTKTKIVASFGSIAASGGYYIATASDHIYCEETGITGSIGVMAQVPTVEGLLQKVGVDMHVIVADGSPDKDVANNIYEDWEPGDENELAVKRLLNNAYDRFVTVVVNGRPDLTEERVRELANGAIYNADEAFKNGLVDDVGYLDAAITKAASLAGIAGRPKVTRIRRPQSLGLIGALVEYQKPTLADISPQKLRDMADELGEVRLAYRMILR